MPPEYAQHAIEARWQLYWEHEGLFRRRAEAADKYYCLMMYPYPSGALHMGHVINYSLGDALVRYHLKNGKNVFCPMGWDAFGLPAENAAIRTGVHPSRFTCANIERMRQQMKRAGWAYDWSAEVACSHPGYYKWTQWLFVQFYKHGLAVKKEAPVNWCPACMTVLANEQVHDGGCERCGTPVEAKYLSQWFFTMSQYAERLLEGHKKLAGKWPPRVLKMQQEWLGRSEGAMLTFSVAETGQAIPVFTTRPDTVYGVTFLVLAPEYPLIPELMRGRPNEAQVLAAAAAMRKQSRDYRTAADTGKEGVATGLHIMNPFNGDKCPLYIANYALIEYGTGAVMAVPAHDQRDFEFAKKYGIPIKVVIQPADEPLEAANMTQAYVEDGVQVNSGQFDGMSNRIAWQAIVEYGAQRGFAEKTVQYRLKDWLISRQRYWGAPIPIVYCQHCGTLPVPEEDLPVRLPDGVEFRPTGESPLARCPQFVNTKCPKCGGPAKRETDTMDTFVDSSWYFLRYLSPRNESAAFDAEQLRQWMPVDMYVGGIEHATMHLIYARFFTMALHDMGLLDFDEPFERLFCQGMVCKAAYRCPRHLWLPESDVDASTMTCRKCGKPVHSEMAKMSKTKLNVVGPDEVVERYGADTMHTYILFMGPPDQDMAYSEQGLIGVYRFLRRFYETVAAAELPLPPGEGWGEGLSITPQDRELRKLLHLNMRRSTEAFEGSFHFNTVIAGCMETLNAYREAEAALSPPVKREVLEGLVQLMSPFAPHLAEELWRTLGHSDSIFRTPWPQCDEAALTLDTIEYPVQVNGRLRARINVPADAADADIQKTALAAAAKWTEGLAVAKVIIVPNRLVNVVAR